MTTPMLGRAVRDEWALDWDWLHVNHGSFGAAREPATSLQLRCGLWHRLNEAGRLLGALREVRHGSQIAGQGCLDYWFSSRGIGLATAKAFAAEGCRVMLSARSTEQLREAEMALHAAP